MTVAHLRGTACRHVLVDSDAETAINDLHRISTDSSLLTEAAARYTRDELRGYEHRVAQLFEAAGADLHEARRIWDEQAADLREARARRTLSVRPRNQPSTG